MDDREFFDKLYQIWARTTHAQSRYWDYQLDGNVGLQVIRSVGEAGDAIEVAWDVFEVDAEFITAIHGCLPDLVRRLHSALDEADAAIFERDSQECRIAELELELAELRKQL